MTSGMETLQINSGSHEDLAQNRSKVLIFTVLTVALILLLILDIFTGSVSLSATEVINSIFGKSGDTSALIVTKFRIPKALTAILVGVSLSLSGLQMQTLFRNPMAGPYVLGVSSGASLGVAMVVLGFSSSIMPAGLSFPGSWTLVFSAWIGAGAIMVLIFFISTRVKEIMTVLIIGIMLASGISAVVTIMQYFSNETMLKAYVIWTMGSLGNLSGNQLEVLALSASFGIFLSVISIKMMNALLLGEKYAVSLGLNIRRSRLLIFACTSILAGSVTAFCGPIGFVGIAVPHIVRNIFRTSDHKILVPGSILAGGSIMLASDIISQLPGSDNVLPINSVTALIGIPVVIWVILRNRKNSELF
jgi:iron complex transport system permease protein